MESVALRIPDDVIEQARSVAQEEGLPLDAMLLELITSGIDQHRDLRRLRERAERANVDAALAILARAPDVAPDPGDEPVAP